MLLTLYNIYTKKADIIKRYVEEEKETYFNRIYEMKHLFYASFYEQCIESTIADAYEYFVELESSNNFFYDNIKYMNAEKGRRFFKLMAMHHTIKVMRKNRMDIDTAKMKEALIYIFDLCHKEQKLFELLYQCACQYENQFERVFAYSLGKYLFDKEISTPFSFAFIQNFCYNSYMNFMQSFTKYITLDNRLKKTAN